MEDLIRALCLETLVRSSRSDFAGRSSRIIFLGDSILGMRAAESKNRYRRDRDRDDIVTDSGRLTFLAPEVNCQVMGRYFTCDTA